MGAQLDEISAAIGGMRADIQHLTGKVDRLETKVNDLIEEKSERRGAIWMGRFFIGGLASGATVLATKAGVILAAIK